MLVFVTTGHCWCLMVNAQVIYVGAWWRLLGRNVVVLQRMLELLKDINVCWRTVACVGEL